MTKMTENKAFEITSGDVRRTRGGIQLSLATGVIPPYIARIGEDMAEEWAHAIETGDRYWWPSKSHPGLLIAYVPEMHGDPPAGFLVFVDAQDDSKEPAVSFRLAADLTNWKEVAVAFRQALALPTVPDSDPSAPWEPEEWMPCDRCARPVFDSDTSVLVAGIPTMHLCQQCAGAGFDLLETG